MVSRVAVIALVAIVACPILMGYAMNLNEVTVTDYKETGNSINVTPLLQSGTAYSYAHADSNQINSNFQDGANTAIPLYESIIDTNTSIQLEQYTYPRSGGYLPWGSTFSTYPVYYFQTDYNGTGGYVRFNIYDANNTLWYYVDCIRSVYWDTSIGDITITYYSNPSNVNSYSGTTFPVPDNYIFEFVEVGSYTSTSYIVRYNPNSDKFVDISAGYHFNGPASGSSNWRIRMPTNTKSALISVNLDSITDSNYSVTIDQYVLQKVTVGSEVTWSYYRVGHPSETQDLYYDPAISNNTYQIYIEYSNNSDPSDNPSYPDPYRKYHRYTEFRYIGGWQKLIGPANVYKTYIDEYDLYSMSDVFLNFVGIYGSNRSPTVRVDDAYFRAFEYSVIEDRNYQPSAFNTNPATTISSITKYGASLTFGGNTYAVSNGKIRLGTHDIPVEGMVLGSVPSSSGSGYDNSINGTVISNTPNPSDITFNGSWGASISTIGQSATTYTKTEWTPGQFGWNGIDQNFLMVGLLTSLGVFIALGIYIRRTKANLWPLLIVCGGAAMLFFCML